MIAWLWHLSWLKYYKGAKVINNEENSYKKIVILVKSSITLFFEAKIIYTNILSTQIHNAKLFYFASYMFDIDDEKNKNVITFSHFRNAIKENIKNTKLELRLWKVIPGTTGQSI